MLRAPFLAELGVNRQPVLRTNVRGVARPDLAALAGQAMRLLRPVTALAPVAAQLAADLGRASPQQPCNLRLAMPGFIQDRNLVPFFPGEVVIAYLCNFNVVVTGAWSLHHLTPSIQFIEVALRVGIWEAFSWS